MERLRRHLLLPLQPALRVLPEPGHPYVNLKDQYFPSGNVTAAKYAEINRRLAPAEFREAKAVARDLGLLRLDAPRLAFGM